ncbi:MAG: hypothetical protein ACK5UE_04215 [Chitinophagales bacterium]|jgi:hypothetical protein|nr:hypothetical protein [Sphingobacteriales bacterium]
MEEKKSKFAGLKKIFFTDEYIEESAVSNKIQSKELPTEQENKTIVNQFSISDPALLEKESKNIIDKIYKYLDSINSTEIDFIEVWDAMEEMGGVNETNLKATFAAMKVASKGNLSKDIIVNSGQGYLNKILTQLNEDVKSKKNEIQTIDAKKKDESAFLVSKKKEIEDNIKKLQSEFAQTGSFIKDLEFKYEPKIKEVQTKIAAGTNAIEKISAEINHIIALVNKTL